MVPQYSIATQSWSCRAAFAFWFYSLQQILVNNIHTHSKLLVRCGSKNHMPIVLPESLQSSFLPESKPHKSQHINLQLGRPLKFLSHFIKASTKRKPIILLSATMTSLPHWEKKKLFFHRRPWVTDNIESVAGQKPIRPQSTHVYFQFGSFSDIKLVALMFLLQDFLIRN